MLVGPEFRVRSRGYRTARPLNCSVAWTRGPGPGHLLSTQVTGVVRQTLVDTPDHGGRSERVLAREQATTERGYTPAHKKQDTMPKAPDGTSAIRELKDE